MPSLPRPNIRLTGRRWRILVEGDERAVRRDMDERKGLDYLAARLLNGEAVAPEALEYYGITVRYLGTMWRLSRCRGDEAGWAD